MSTTQIIVNVLGLGLIAWLVWYFWLWKGQSVSARMEAAGLQMIEVTVKGGYQPAAIKVKSGRPLRLSFTRREASLCGEEVVLPELGMRAHLPENVSVTLDVAPLNPGEYEFTCGMNMYKGKLIVEP